MKSYTFYKRISNHVSMLNDDHITEIENLDFMDDFDIELKRDILLSIMNCDDYFMIDIIDYSGLKECYLVKTECKNVSEINAIIAKFWNKYKNLLPTYAEALEIDRIRHMKYKSEYFSHNPRLSYKRHKEIVDGTYF